MSIAPQRQRVASYALIVRDEQILLCRLDSRISRDDLWNLPGGGVEHGEDPRDSVLREIVEETGLDAEVGDRPRIYSAHQPSAWRDGERFDYHALRIVYDGWVRADAPAPRVVEVDGSTVESAWIDLVDVRSGAINVTGIVTEALADHAPFRHQRPSVHALVVRGEEVLLTRISGRGFHCGEWALPGGGIDHGEDPHDSLVREIAEECGLAATVGAVLGLHHDHFSGVAPSGRFEDFHVLDVVFEATVESGRDPVVVDVDGTTDAAAWVPIADVESGAVVTLDVVRRALRWQAERHG